MPWSWNAGEWYSFVIYLDFARQTYTCYVNGWLLAENVRIEPGYEYTAALSFGTAWYGLLSESDGVPGIEYLTLTI